MAEKGCEICIHYQICIFRYKCLKDMGEELSDICPHYLEDK